MGDLRCYLTTYNCGRSLVHTDYFASSLFSKLQPGQLPPDLIVLSLQEFAPIAHSFIGGSFVTPYFAHLEESVSRATSWRFGKDVKYGNIVSSNVGMTAIMVFAEQSVVGKIKWIEEAGTGVGMFEMGNKGAVGVRMSLGFAPDEEDMVVTFVAAHLAPMEEAWERRNEDWKRICENLVFESKEMHAKPSTGSIEAEPLLSADAPQSTTTDQTFGMFVPQSYLFFAGDLNYRTSNTPPKPEDFHSWPQPMADESDPTHYTRLFVRDQLNREREQGRTLHQLSEAQINFPPTYKYSSRAQKLAADHAKAHEAEAERNGKPDVFVGLPLDNATEQVWLWAKHRIPSWCDRILYLTDAPPIVHSYTALPVQPTSDHRPVALSFSIPRKGMDPSHLAKPPFAIANGWKARRAAARRFEILVGLGAYLGVTTPGQSILASAVVGLALVYYFMS